MNKNNFFFFPAGEILKYPRGIYYSDPEVVEEEGKDKVVAENPTGGKKPVKEIDIEKIFERAEHGRHQQHAEEFLDKLVREKIEPLEGDGFLDYDEQYDDFPLYVEWWDYDSDGTYSWQGTLQYFLKYYDYKSGKYYSDDELAAQIEEVRKDILRREEEREEWAKEVAKRLSEGEKNE